MTSLGMGSRVKKGDALRMIRGKLHKSKQGDKHKRIQNFNSHYIYITCEVTLYVFVTFMGHRNSQKGITSLDFFFFFCLFYLAFLFCLNAPISMEHLFVKKEYKKNKISPKDERPRIHPANRGMGVDKLNIRTLISTSTSPVYPSVPEV